jgi:hypothetical protein
MPPTDTGTPSTGTTTHEVGWTQVEHVGNTLEYDRHQFHDVDVLPSDPPLIAVGNLGSADIDWFQEANVGIARWFIDGEYQGLRGGRDLSLSAGLERLPVAFLGDVTGNGELDAGFVTTQSGILEGPFAFPYQGYEAVPAVPWATGWDVARCDVDLDGQSDLCTSAGVDRGPIDGVPDLTWDPGFTGIDRNREHIAIGWDCGPVAYVTSTFGVVQIPLFSTGALDLATLPAWNPPFTGVVADLAVADADGDGTDEVLLCEGNENVSRVKVLTGLVDAPPIFEFQDECDSLVAGDFDGDNVPELAVAGGSTIYLMELDGTLLNTLVGTEEPGTDQLGSGMASADLDHDGRDDLVAGAVGSSTLYMSLRPVP